MKPVSCGSDGNQNGASANLLNDKLRIQLHTRFYFLTMQNADGAHSDCLIKTVSENEKH